ncbi:MULTISPECIES: hydrogenase maturation nickel metallochaperone HypA [Ferrimonas]|uniref:hydrogenase maturation nickel metallochaperone HypA n=1 Tax=Ferrimonas TaxID=44011 RepID=UPI00040A0900|nr:MULTISPECIES: hydrogenase maturation nickel metallochaperone HypA [Ferrimonas]USD36401.1 hydrogenase maturation nickel metallochaperone HypA [Ferrimonas sp. SCSIO 43195]
MHEAALTQSLIKVLLTQAERVKANSISRVTVKVGQLKAVEPQSLSFCFEMFAKDTLIEGAQLVIDHVPARATCHGCQRSFDISRFCFRCDTCQSRDIELIQGEELFIESFET